MKAANSYELVHRAACGKGLSMEVTRRLPEVIVESDFLTPLNEGSVGWDFGFPHNYQGRTLPSIKRGELEGRMLQLKGVRAWKVSSRNRTNNRKARCGDLIHENKDRNYIDKNQNPLVGST